MVISAEELDKTCKNLYIPQDTMFLSGVHQIAIITKGPHIILFKTNIWIDSQYKI